MTYTTRRFPRTLAEAFPHTAEYGCSVIRTRSALPDARTVGAVFVFVVAVLGALALVW